MCFNNFKYKEINDKAFRLLAYCLFVYLFLKTFEKKTINSNILKYFLSQIYLLYLFKFLKINNLVF